MSRDFINAAEFLNVVRALASRGGSVSISLLFSIWRESTFDIVRIAENLGIVERVGDRLRLGPEGVKMLAAHRCHAISAKTHKSRLVLHTSFGPTLADATPSYLMSVAEKLTLACGGDVFETYRNLTSVVERVKASARGLEKWIL